METWTEIVLFPGYSVSDQGRVRNDDAGTPVKPVQNQFGLTHVGLTKAKKQYKRSLAVLVATAYVHRPKDVFDTPIHLNGDRSDCRAENLVWRPRWFAVKFHKQFEDDNVWSTVLVDTRTGDRYDSPMDAVVANGLLFKDLFLSVQNKTFVWPTYQTFEREASWQ
jgi:hypothetical protein